MDRGVHGGALLAGDMPVHEEQVQVVQLEVTQDLLARLRNPLGVMIRVVQLQAREMESSGIARALKA